MKKTFNIEGWPQDEINLLQANLVAVLADMGTEYSSVQCVGNQCEICDPTGPAEVEEQQLRAKHAEECAKREAAEQEYD